MKSNPTLGEFIAHHGRPSKLEAGQRVFHEGDVSTAVYACLSGRINVFITTPTGRDLILGSKSPIQGFGELSAIDAGPRSASAVAVEPTVVAQIPGEQFRVWLAELPQLALTVMRELAEQVRRDNARASAWASENITQRVGHLLVDLTAKYHRHGQPTDPTDLPITQDEVAAWVGASRESTARALAVLRRTGAIETARHKIVVIDCRALIRVLSARATTEGSAIRQATGVRAL